MITFTRKSINTVLLGLGIAIVNLSFASVPYRAICIPHTPQSLEGIDQQLIKDGLADISYSTVEGARVYFHFDPQSVTVLTPSKAMSAGAENNDALIMSGFNKQVFITQNRERYPFVAKLFNQKRGIKQGAPLKPAKSLDELKAMGIEFTTLTDMNNLLHDAHKALRF